MTNACFTKSEAVSHMNAEVVAAADLPGIPAGSRGCVVDSCDGGARGWLVRVNWELPPQRSEIMAMVGDVSVNVPWKTPVPTVDFSKSEFERLLRAGNV
jgi:hypothetical protein